MARSQMEFGMSPTLIKSELISTASEEHVYS